MGPCSPEQLKMGSCFFFFFFFFGIDGNNMFVRREILTFIVICYCFASNIFLFSLILNSIWSLDGMQKGYVIKSNINPFSPVDQDIYVYVLQTV